MELMDILFILLATSSISEYFVFRKKRKDDKKMVDRLIKLNKNLSESNDALIEQNARLLVQVGGIMGIDPDPKIVELANLRDAPESSQPTDIPHGEL